MLIVVMGVAGAGKTHVGRELAAALGWPFFDADDYHSGSAVSQMAAGLPLSDSDREPWLERLRQLLAELSWRGENAVLACSALRGEFRARLAEGIEDVRFVHLKADRALLAERLRERPGHFFPPSLLESQLAALEAPSDAIVVNAAQPSAEIVRQIRAAL